MKFSLFQRVGNILEVFQEAQSQHPSALDDVLFEMSAVKEMAFTQDDCFYTGL